MTLYIVGSECGTAAGKVSLIKDEVLEKLMSRNNLKHKEIMVNNFFVRQLKSK